MKINTLSLENYRCFRQFSIDFHPQLTVIVAENGSGKTAILEAITVAFGSFVGCFDEGKGYVFKPHDVRLLKTSQTQINIMEPQYPLTLEATGEISGISQTWFRSLNNKKSKTTIKQTTALRTFAQALQDKVRVGENVELPLLAYYGTERLSRKTKLSQNRLAKPSYSRTIGYDECFNPASNYRIFADWFIQLEQADFEHRMLQEQNQQIVTSSDFSDLLNCVKRAVNTCLKTVSGWHNLQYRASFKTLTVEHKDHGYLPVDQLSDGIRNLLALVGDIAYRAARLNPHLKAQAALEATGIVLIDEIDLHLHPRWQQTVLHDLMKAFPKLQFIVTTHSPQVLSAVKQEKIRLINTEKPQALQPAINPYAQESRVALEDIFGVDSRAPLKETDDLKTYLQQLEEGDYDSDEVLDMRQKLEVVFGAGDINLEMADMFISKLKAKKVRD